MGVVTRRVETGSSWDGRIGNRRRCNPTRANLHPHGTALITFALGTACLAQSSSSLSPEVKEFVKLDAPVVALIHVRVVDGTGSAARPDQTIVIAGGKIQNLGDAATVLPPAGAQVLDLSGWS